MMIFGIITLKIINVIWHRDFKHDNSWLNGIKHNKIWHNAIKHNGIWQKEYEFGIGELSLIALSRMTFDITTFSTLAIIIWDGIDYYYDQANAIAYWHSP